MNTKLVKTFAAGLVVSFLTATAGYAAEVKVSGILLQSTQVNSNVTLAAGTLASAKTRIGAIKDAHVSGILLQSTRVNSNVTLAAGTLASAETSIGTIGF